MVRPEHRVLWLTRRIVPFILPILLIGLLAPLFSPVYATYSPLQYVNGKSWVESFKNTRTASGSGGYSGRWSSTQTETVTYTLSDLTDDNFVISGSWTGQQVQTASGTWVKPSGGTCDGCSTTNTFSGQGTLTVSRTAYLVTAVSGDYTQDNVGRPIWSMVDPTNLQQGKSVTVWWYDQNNNYLPLSLTKSSEKSVSIGGATAKTAAVTHNGQSSGYWDVSGKYSSGPETDTWYFDESTGVQIEYDASGSYTFSSGDGQWTETAQVNDLVSSATFNIGDWVVVGSDPATSLSVDSSSLSASSQPALYVWTWDSSHTISAPPTVDVSPGSRLVFNSWDDGTQDATRTVSATQPTQYQADYKKQYLLTITSPYGTPVGAGWYDEGSTASIHIDSSYLFWDFAGWSGSSIPPNPDAQLTMTGPVSLQANWSVDFLRVAVVILAIVGIVVGFVFYRRKGVRVRNRQAMVPVSRVFCASCGAPIQEAAKFCRKCGSPQN